MFSSLLCPVFPRADMEAGDLVVLLAGSESQWRRSCGVLGRLRTSLATQMQQKGKLNRIIRVSRRQTGGDLTQQASSDEGRGGWVAFVFCVFCLRMCLRVFGCASAVLAACLVWAVAQA